MDTKDYVFPFEGEKHRMTIVMLPYRTDTWREKAKPAMAEFKELVSLISKFEPVLVLYDPKHFSRASLYKFPKRNVSLLPLPYDDSWARDPLPVFLRSKDGTALAGVDFGFNAWGGSYDGLYSPYDQDNAIGKKLLTSLNIPRVDEKDFVLEGGSVHSDGEGTLLTTECCLLSPGRNPSLNKGQIEEKLKKTLNVQKVLWLPKGIVNDETDGHVDNICCFLEPGTVLLAVSKDKNDPQYGDSLLDKQYLESVTDARGRKLKIVEVPVPTPPLTLSEAEAKGIAQSKTAVSRLKGRRLAASYVNFYMGEKFVILPKFGVKEDEIAFKILKDFYKGKKEVFQLESREILLGGGNIHCVTKQVPFVEDAVDL